jgi:hypothetical protein
VWPCQHVVVIDSTASHHSHCANAHDTGLAIHGTSGDLSIVESLDSTRASPKLELSGAALSRSLHPKMIEFVAWILGVHCRDVLVNGRVPCAVRRSVHRIDIGRVLASASATRQVVSAFRRREQPCFRRVDGARAYLRLCRFKRLVNHTQFRARLTRRDFCRLGCVRRRARHKKECENERT